MRLRAQLLLAVVCGNIRMAMRERSSIVRHDSSLEDPECLKTVVVVHNSVWKRIMTMVYDYEASRTEGGQHETVSLPIKLKSLLNSQAR
jgi:hypothetical protein